jgi:aspartate/methionine/tyrosine aminotransferase
MVGGDSFGDDECIRISYATNEEKLIDACNRLKAFFLKVVDTKKIYKTFS